MSVNASDQFMTPPDVIEDARRVMGGIDLDPASHWIAQEYVKAKRFCVDPSSMEEWLGYGDCPPDNLIFGGLTYNWSNANYSVWCNPPYSRGLINQFVNKALEEWNKNTPFSIENMMLLTNSQTDTKWYQNLLNECSAACLHRGRMKFWKMFDGKAHEKWEGEKSKQEGRGRISNQPRYLNTVFYFTRGNIDTFVDVFGKHGTIVQVAGKENEYQPFLRSNVLYLDEYRRV
jgi:hypothetical protein